MTKSLSLDSCKHKRLGRQVIDLLGLALLEGADQGVLIEQVAWQQLDLVLKCASRSKLIVLLRRTRL